MMSKYIDATHHQFDTSTFNGGQNLSTIHYHYGWFSSEHTGYEYGLLTCPSMARDGSQDNADLEQLHEVLKPRKWNNRTSYF